MNYKTLKEKAQTLKQARRQISTRTWVILFHKLAKSRLDLVLAGSSRDAQDVVVIRLLLLPYSLIVQAPLAPQR